MASTTLQKTNSSQSVPPAPFTASDEPDAYPFPRPSQASRGAEKALPALPEDENIKKTTSGPDSAASSDRAYRLQGSKHEKNRSPPSSLKPVTRKPLPGSLSNGHIRSVSEEFSESNRPTIGTATPPDRRSVQFSRDTVDNEPGEGNQKAKPRSDTTDESELGQSKGRNASLYAKLKAIATTAPSFSHTRSGSDYISQDKVDSAPDTPTSSRWGMAFPMTLEERSEDDADVDDSGEEVDPQTPSKAKRKPQRRSRPIMHAAATSTAPSSPRSFRPPFLSASSTGMSESPTRPGFMVRRATDGTSPHTREGYSEDEGRARMRAERTWRKSVWARGQTESNERSGDEAAAATSDERRPSQLRRITGMGSPGEGLGGVPWRRHKADRGTSLGGQKWRELKARMNLIGQRKKKERTIDHEKSAELLAELSAGPPAALILASMFQRDQQGHKRIPVLLEQLKISITDSEIDKHGTFEVAHAGDRPSIFRIELEYGNGVNRMKWTVHRSIRDFIQLHGAYKTHYAKEKLKLQGADDSNMPKFPWSAFPYARGFLRVEFEDEYDEEEDGVGNEAGASGNERPGVRNRPRSSFVLSRRKSSNAQQSSTTNVAGALPEARGSSGAIGSAAVRRETFPERQRRKLEVYLRTMIKFMLLRADSNRLCRFLEISALGLRLAAEGGYHGKEGHLIIRTAKGVDFRQAIMNPRLTNFWKRHSPKWYVVRASYIVCLDGPEEMHIYEVFLFDSEFQLQSNRLRLKNQTPKQIAQSAKEAASKPQHHRLKIRNSERRVKLLARHERILHQFEESITMAADQTLWTKKHRFDSYAPVRTKCFAQWLVDGRDHMWLVSKAIDQAKDCIYIHDWWLSPELYMRRPASLGGKWRLDRLLKAKAEQGVKIFVIMYRNIEQAIPIDSNYSKFALLDLHPNIYVQRSPNQIREKQALFWAHHEKLCLIDNTVAFVGGIDLCFGRWDTPQHTLVDDKPTGFEDTTLPKDSQHSQLWIGKDYSNARIQDFFALNKPFDEMYDREEIPRMPWHDISMQVIGQPARDLTRHFVQRWNYILRQRRPTRPTPFLLPPPDLTPADIEALGLEGTCEVQMLRSCGPWSIGTSTRVEHSIMNAYCKMIEQSEHFVYMENQFFISSCSTDTTRIQNSIGDALVERVIRAAKNGEVWRANILIPLIPGFQNTVAEAGGTSVRLIMQYQYRSICRGESSIFGRLRAQGIDPEEYIQFYSLRNWGKIGPKKMLVTEQLYIHAKCMIVDDRIAIIGSANINERSMLGNRDSECAAVVRDTDMIWSRMNGKRYLVGRFPHTLRMRLMREHLGLDVDKHMAETPFQKDPILSPTSGVASPNDPESEDPTSGQTSPRKHAGVPMGPSAAELAEGLLDRAENIHSFNHDVDWEQAENPNLMSTRKVTEDPRVTGHAEHKRDITGQGFDQMDKLEKAGLGVGRDTMTVGFKEVLTSDLATEGKGSIKNPKKRGQSTEELVSREAAEKEMNPPMPPRPPLKQLNTEDLGLAKLSQLPALPSGDDTDIGGPNALHPSRSADNAHPLKHELHIPMVDEYCMKDPVIDTFSFDTWHAVAENNTRIYRAVFRCMPDSEVRDWHGYNEYSRYDRRFMEMQGYSGDWKPKNKEFAATAQKAKESTTTSGPPGMSLAETHNPAIVVANLPTATGKAAGDIAGEIKQRVMAAVSDGTKEDAGSVEKDPLRAWALEANRKQFERQDREREINEKQATRTSQEEKQNLNIPETVHENRPTTNNGSVNTLDNHSSTQTTDTTPTQVEHAEHAEPTLNTTLTNNSTPSSAHPTSATSHIPPQRIDSSPTQPFVGYSEALNANYRNSTNGANHTPSTRRRRATTSTRPGGVSGGLPGGLGLAGTGEFTASSDIPTKAQAEELLNMVQGHLICWPYEWLEQVEMGGNWLFPKDHLTPLEIYV